MKRNMLKIMILGALALVAQNVEAVRYALPKQPTAPTKGAGKLDVPMTAIEDKIVAQAVVDALNGAVSAEDAQAVINIADKHGVNLEDVINDPEVTAELGKAGRVTDEDETNAVMLAFQAAHQKALANIPAFLDENRKEFNAGASWGEVGLGYGFNTYLSKIIQRKNNSNIADNNEAWLKALEYYKITQADINKLGVSLTDLTRYIIANQE